MSQAPIVFVQTPAELHAALGDLGERVAVDTEFHAEHHYFPQLKLIQIRDESGPPILIDPLALRDLSPLGAALSQRTLLLHAPTQDLQLLAVRCGLRPNRVFDTQIFAGFAGFGYPTSLGTLSGEVLKLGLHRGSTLSNWQQRPLTEAQKEYAASDVRWLHALFDALWARLDEVGRTRATAATAELVRGSLTPPDPELLWLELPGGAILDGQGRAALRRLAAWREATARRLDQPRWQIAPDSALIDLSRRRPADAMAIAENRKVPKRLAREFAEEVLMALDEAAEEPKDLWPPSVTVRRDSAVLDHLLAAWAHRVDAEEGVAASLVMPDPLRRALVLHQLDDRWPAPDLGWRQQPYGAPIAAITSGDKSISMRKDRA